MVHTMGKVRWSMTVRWSWCLENLVFVFKENLGIYIWESSINGGTPNSSILVGFSGIDHPFLGTPLLGNPQMFSWFMLGTLVDLSDVRWMHRMILGHKRKLAFDPENWQNEDYKGWRLIKYRDSPDLWGLLAFPMLWGYLFTRFCWENQTYVASNIRRKVQLVNRGLDCRKGDLKPLTMPEH